jgi:hypothetical protein
MAMWRTFTVQRKCALAKFRQLKTGINFPEDRKFAALVAKASPFLITITPSIYTSVLQK